LTMCEMDGKSFAIVIELVAGTLELVGP